MTRELRKDTKKFGLVLANGGVLTHQNVIILAKQPNKASIPYADQDSHADIDLTVPAFVEKAQGQATIEVRKNQPRQVVVIG